jgi:predicted deacylase
VTIYQSLKDVPHVPGKHLVRIPVTTDMNGMEVVIWSHLIIGAKDGPRLTLLSGLHGNEWLHLEFFRRFVQDCNPDELSGTVVVVPMANVVAFGQLSRSVPDDSDNADANRSFPGKGRRFTWLAEQIATQIATEILQESDYMLDFHSGLWGATMGSSIVGIDYSDPEIVAKSQDLSYAFGNPLVFTARMVNRFPGPRSSQGYAGEVLGIPCCGSMLGGAGFDRDQEETWHRMNLRGIQNVMAHVGMLEDRLHLPEQYLTYEMVHRINPRVGGLLEPVHEVETFGRELQAGELLGRVISPFTFEVLEELTVPTDGYLAYWARMYPLRPGDWAYGVIPVDHPGTHWVPRPGW